MRKINQVGAFKRDYRRINQGKQSSDFDLILAEIIANLRSDIPLAAKYRDHPLQGKWKGHRECHVKPDILLIYRKTNDNILELIRLGSHSELKLG